MSKLIINAGDQVTFTGFTGDDMPDNGELLVEGEQYEVESINEAEGDNEASYNITVTNPDFNSKKRKSKANWDTKLVDVFPDECAGIEEGGEGSGEDEASIMEFSEVQKGDIVTVLDTEGESLTGSVFKKTKTLLGIVVTEDDGTEDEVTYKSKEIEAIYDSAEEEQEEEPAPEKKAPAKKKAASKKAPAKKKTTSKKAPAKKTASKKKTTSKKKAPAKKEQVDEDLKNLLVLEEDEEDEEIIGLVQDATADELCELAAELDEESALSEFKLAGILYHVKKDKAFRQIDDGRYDVDGGFAQYCEEELAVGYRKAQYLIKIYTVGTRYGLNAEQVAEMGWTKAAVIVDSMDEDNAEKLIELAGENTVTDLKDTIKESYTKKGKDEREIVKRITFKFRLAEDAAASVDGYLEQAGEQLGLKKPEDIFEHIITEWAGEHLDIKPARKTKTSAKSRGRGGKKG